jgi:hypothetical protein
VSHQPPPGNGDAVAGFVCSVVGGSLLIVSAGLSSLVSLILAIVGIVYSRRGKRNVQEGRTPQHSDLASAGFIVGIVSTALSVLAILFWGALIVIGLTEPDWIDDEQDDPFDDEFQFQTAVRLAAHAVRLLA